jgi:acetyl esterase/lipase
MLRTSCLLIGFTFCLAAGAAEPATRPSTRPSPLVIPLWDHGVPNAPTTKPDPERDDGTGRVWNVSVPAMLVYLPPQGDDHAAPRMAIVHCAAGGYTHLTRLAGADGFVDEFVRRGVAVIALKYRLRPASSDVERDARDDAQRAIQLVRANAKAWNIDPHRVGLVGASAGANAVLNVVSHGTSDESARPDFVGLLSPWPDQHDASLYLIPKTAPPAFIASARDDRTAPCTFAQAIAKGYESAGVPHEFWLIDAGGHGAFTIGGTGEGAGWPPRFRDWLTRISMNP